MSQSLACPHCGKNYVISERYSGASVKCQFCGERFRVPEEELIPDAVFIDEAPPQYSSSAGRHPVVEELDDYAVYDDYDDSVKRVGAEPSRMTAAVLAFILGTLGVHHFYTGQTSKGVHCLIWPLFTCGLAMFAFTVLGIIDGIRYTSMSDQEWSHRWQNYAL
jgi:hypothetical protein